MSFSSILATFNQWEVRGRAGGGISRAGAGAGGRGQQPAGTLEEFVQEVWNTWEWTQMTVNRIE